MPSRLAYSRATSLMIRAGTPHTGAIRSGLYPSTLFFRSS